MKTNYTLYTNGIVRNSARHIVAYWDSEEKSLMISGHPLIHGGMDTEEIMFDRLVAIVGTNYMVGEGVP